MTHYPHKNLRDTDRFFSIPVKLSRRLYRSLSNSASRNFKFLYVFFTEILFTGIVCRNSLRSLCLIQCRIQLPERRREILLVAVRVIDPAILLVGIHFNIVQCHAAICRDREIVVFLPRDGTLIISRFRHLNQLFSVTDLEGDLRCTVLRRRPTLHGFCPSVQDVHGHSG